MSKKLLFNFNREVVQDYTYIKYSGTIITATNTLEKPIKGAILKGSTKYRDIDTGEFLETFEEGRNLELVSVKMPVLKAMNDNFFVAKDGDLIIGRMNGTTGASVPTNLYGVILREDLFLDAIPNKYCWFFPSSTENANDNLFFYDKDYNFIKKINQYTLVPENARYMKFSYSTNGYATQNHIDSLRNEARIGYFDSWNPNPKYEEIPPQHKSNILTVNEDVTLRSNGDICDELNLLTGQLTQRIGEDGVVLSQEVIKTVDLSALDQDGNKVSSISSYNDATHITTSSETISPIFEGYIATKEGE